MKAQLIQNLVLLLALAAAPAAAEQDEVKLGLSIALSGPWASWGEPIKNGLLLGAEKAGSRLTIDVQDDKCRAELALTNFQKFLSADGYKLLLLGCVECVDAIAPLLERYDAVVFTLGGMTEEAARRYPRVQGLYSTVDSEVRYIVPFLAKEVKSFAVLTHTGLFGEVFGDSLERRGRKRGLIITGRERVTADETDFRAIIARILLKRPGAVAVHTGDTSEGLFIKQLRQAGYKGRITAGHSFESELVRGSGGAALEGVIYTYPVNEVSDPAKYEAFAAEYTKRFDAAPNSNAAIAYDAMLLLGEAIAKCGAGDRTCVLSFFAGLGRYRGLGGDLLIDHGRLPVRPYGLKQYVNGEYRWLTKQITADE